MRRIGIITVSDRASAGEYEDRSGPVVEQVIHQRFGWQVAERVLVPDDRERITRELVRMADEGGLDLVVTTGGTGFAPRGVAPAATRDPSERGARRLAEGPWGASGVRHPWADADRQPTGQPEGCAGESRGHPARAAACA